MELLRLENVRSLAPSGGDGTEEVLRGVSFSLDPGSLSVLIGRSGGGKSTLLRLLNRLDTPTSGKICFRQKGLSDYPPGDLRREVVLLAQRPVLFPGTVLENILLPAHLARLNVSSEHQQRAKQCLRACQVPEPIFQQDAAALSVGQQQRVALARALFMEPSLLLADEPTSALDRPTATLVAKTLKRFSRQEGRAALMVSHDLDLAATYADRVLFLENGQIIEQGAPEKMFRSPRSGELRGFLSSLPDTVDD